MKVYEVNGLFFLDLEQAELHALNTHYKVKHHDVNDSENLEVECEGQDVYIVSENDERTDVFYEVYTRDITSYEDEETVMMFEHENITVKGVPLERAELSDRLKKEIENSVQNAIDNLNDEQE